MACAESQGISWQEAVSLFQFQKSDYLAVLYRTFIDDSADERREDVVTAGAVFATQGLWNIVRREWTKRLQRDDVGYFHSDDVGYFHSTDYYSLKGEFFRYRDSTKYPKPKGSEAAKALRDDLEAILQKSHVIGMGVAIPIKLYNQLPSYRSRCGPQTFARCICVCHAVANSSG